MSRESEDRAAATFFACVTRGQRQARQFTPLGLQLQSDWDHSGMGATASMFHAASPVFAIFEARVSTHKLRIHVPIWKIRIPRAPYPNHKRCVNRKISSRVFWKRW